MSIFEKTNTVDIGGDRYYFGGLGNSDFELGFKSEQSFYNNFIPKGRDGDKHHIKNLFIKYFPFGIDYKQIKYTEKDLAEVKTIISNRIDNIKKTLRHNSISIVNIPIWTNHLELGKILNYLDTYSFTKQEIAEQGEIDKRIIDFKETDDPDKFKLLLGMMWYFMNPEKIEEGELQDNITETIQHLQSQESTFPKLTGNALDNLKYVDITQVYKKPTMKNAFDNIEQQVTDGIKKNEYINNVDNMLERVLTVLQTHQYINQNQAIPSIKQLNKTSFDQFIKNIDIALINKIDEDLDPSFEYIKSVFTPIYNMLSDFLNYRNNQSLISIHEITKIIHFINHVDKSKTGITELINMNQNMIELLKALVEYIGNHKDRDNIIKGILNLETKQNNQPHINTSVLLYLTDNLSIEINEKTPSNIKDSFKTIYDIEEESVLPKSIINIDYTQTKAAYEYLKSSNKVIMIISKSQKPSYTEKLNETPYSHYSYDMKDLVSTKDTIKPVKEIIDYFSEVDHLIEETGYHVNIANIIPSITQTIGINSELLSILTLVFIKEKLLDRKEDA